MHPEDVMQYTHPEYLLSTQELADLHTADPQHESVRVFDTSITLKPNPAGGYMAESGYDDYLQARIPGAGFLDLKTKLSDTSSGLGFTLPGTEQLQAGFRAAGINSNSRVVLYSSGHMMWATRAWWMLHSAGHGNVCVLNGGLAKWQAEDRDTQQGEAWYAAGVFSVDLNAAKWADKNDVMQAIGDEAICTINALAPGVYSGSADMSYGRKGHITGSKNIYYGDVLDAGCFRSASDLKELFNAKNVLDRPKVIAYCGGGISATIDALALSLLGHKNLAVYDGSMSEWVKDKDLPLVLGEH
jgi:thiosulfate/3-mercaptopyruvate sulfurtransferase